MPLEISEFLTPTFHLVIADDQPLSVQKLRERFQKLFDEWCLSKAKQLVIEVHTPITVQEFTEETAKWLDLGHFVYAVVDLIMPLKRGETQPDRNALQESIRWCLTQQSDRDSSSGRFEFCCISGDVDKMDKMFQQGDFAANLRRRGIKRLSKKELASNVSGDLAHTPLWDDIRQFVHRNLRFCTIPDRPLDEGDERAEQPPRTLIWIGRHEALVRKLAQADRLAHEEKGKVYLIFSDAGGFEEDWFRLFCHLRRIQTWGIHDFSNISRFERAWSKDLSNPPNDLDALLLRNVHFAKRNGCDLKTVIDKHQVFADFEKRGRFLFLQFPYLERQFDSQVFDQRTREFFEDCLEHIYHSRNGIPKGTDFAFQEHYQVIKFPTYETLKSAEVVSRGIAFQVLESQRNRKLPDVTLSAEVAELLAEIPWQEHVGLRLMRQEIDNAFEVAQNGDYRCDRYLPLDCFDSGSVLREYVCNAYGFKIRGSWLFQQLKENQSPSRRVKQELDYDEAESGLIAIYELFDGLARLIQLGQDLQEEGQLRFSADFGHDRYATLQKAHEFLEGIFGKPSELLTRIERFQEHEDSEHWWDEYPSLRERDDWMELVKNIPLTWPLVEFLLPTAINDYLELSGVIKEIHSDIVSVLEPYEDFQEEWNEIDRKRASFLERLQKCEEQRRAAERYIRQSNSQPVMTFLKPIRSLQNPDFVATLQSLVFFNTALAICEHHYIFGGEVCDKALALRALNEESLLPSITFLGAYLSGLECRIEKSKSVFAKWMSTWPEQGQQDARRLARIVAKRLLLVYQDSLDSRERAVVNRISNLEQSKGECMCEDLLSMLAVIPKLRQTFPVKVDAFLAQNQRIMRDLLRRFIKATTHDSLRFGIVGEDGQSAQLWTRRTDPIIGFQVDQVPAVAHNESLLGRTCAFVESDPHQAIFAVHDLLRTNPEDGSVWTYFSRGRWFNLTYQGPDAAQQTVIPGINYPWLPEQHDFVESDIWKSLHA